MLRSTFWIFAENAGGSVEVGLGVASSVVSDGTGDAVSGTDGLGCRASLRGPAAPSAPAEVPPPHAVAAATARSPR
ncbi:hypothetical protein GCM10010106_16230 [Thermopolyspora flexuosa]|nr:hypothetical protein GCM10010106_16230 [Thermopolyspora flexuosa]